MGLLSGGDGDYTAIQSVAEDWGNDSEAANKWVTLMAEAFRQIATTA